MHRLIIFIMGAAIVALAFSLISVSTVALLAQTSALFSQCAVALVLPALGGAVVGSLVLRQRVVQLYLAQRLLGEEADRLLAQPQPDQTTALSAAFPQQQLYLPPVVASAKPALRPHQVPPPSAMPAMPRGWGFDEED